MPMGSRDLIIIGTLNNKIIVCDRNSCCFLVIPEKTYYGNPMKIKFYFNIRTITRNLK